MIKRFPLWILLITVGIVFHRVLMGEVFFWGLPALQFVPWRDYSTEVLFRAGLPLWNPLNGAGTPLLANYQSGLFYPLNWLSFFLPTAWAMSMIAIAHLFIGGAGMWAFTGRLGLPNFGRGISTLAFGLTAYTVARLGTYPTISAAVWLPWLLWAAWGVVTRGWRWDIAWVTLFTALQLLAGHAQTTWYSLVLTGVFALYKTLAPDANAVAPPAWRQRFWRLALIVGGMLLAALIAAVQLIPTAELLLNSTRSGGENVERVMNFSYGFARTITLFSPNFFGNPARGDFITGGAFFEDATYVGLLTVVGAFAALVAWLRRRRDPQRPPYLNDAPFWLGIIVVGFLLAFGDNTPLFPFLYQNVPTFNAFQAPTRWHLWTVCALCILGGIGMSAAWGVGARRARWVQQALVVCMGAALAGFGGLLLLSPDGGTSVIMRGVGETAIFGTLISVLYLTLPNLDTPRRPLWDTLALALLAADLAYAAWGLNPTVPAQFYDHSPDVPEPRAHWTAQAEYRVQVQTLYTFSDYRIATERWQEARQTPLPNLNLLDRDQQFTLFDPLQIAHHEQYRALLDAAEGAARENLMRAAAIGILYTLEPELETVELQGVPQAWLATLVCWHTSEESLVRAITADDWNPYAQVHLLGDAGCSAQGEIDSAFVRVKHGYNRDEIEANVSGPDRWLVLADTYYPGWEAFVCNAEGAECQNAYIYRANLTFRALQLPAGEHVVRFEYRPSWLLPAAFTSVIALIIWLVLFRTQSPEQRQGAY